MIFNIEPYVGFENIKFGMTISETRKNLSSKFESFKRTSSSIYPCDHFDSLNIFIYYKRPGIIEAMEFYPPSTLLYEGQSLFDLSYTELKKFLLSKDKNLEVEDDFSLTSYLLGIGVYSPNAEENPNLQAESIIIFEKDYYK